MRHSTIQMLEEGSQQTRPDVRIRLAAAWRVARSWWTSGPQAQRAREGSLPGALAIERNVLEWRLRSDLARRGCARR